MSNTLLMRPHAFERGERVYLTTPLTLATPSAGQIEEFAFASAVKSLAPNENIGWLAGRYVESEKANLNGAMWLSDELALKALTPMLMPVTVMHDPRTAVGTIADCKLIPESRSRIETILAVWKHRFGDVWDEAEANLKNGELAQSMECMSPSYSCSECGTTYIKLHEGKEQASWCDHLRSNSSCRILGDVCFTGTGLIFGSRGGQPAYTEASLDHFHDEIAEFHERAHIDGSYKPREEKPKMGFVQIDETELASLRSDRDKARDEVAEVRRDLTTKVEQAEGEAAKEKTRADTAETKLREVEDKAGQAELRTRRWDSLGTGFIAKLGEVTKKNLQESASTLSDEDWNTRLAEVEELTSTKRDSAAAAAAAAGSGGAGESAKDSGAEGSSFSDDEVASFAQRRVTAPAAATTGDGTAARSLARALKPQRQAAATK